MEPVRTLTIKNALEKNPFHEFKKRVMSIDSEYKIIKDGFWALESQDLSKTNSSELDEIIYQ